MFVFHPIIEKKIPVWIANFTLQSYGTKALLSVPGHNENDWNFAIQYNLEVKYVILNSETQKLKKHTSFIDTKGILFNSQEFNGLNFQESTEEIKKILFKKKILKEKIKYKLQDWCVSRQRYWGAPIPMAKLKNGKFIPIPEDKLPVLLPDITNSIHTSDKNINSNSKWTKIFIDGHTAIKETDTFDTFMESSWYYARYTCPHFNKGMIDPRASKYWLPVDQYIGGIEHAIMHLMYFRFYNKLLRDFKLVNFDEPVKNLLCQGMVLSEAFYEIGDHSQRNWIHSSSVLKKRDEKGKIIRSYNTEGKELVYAGMIKMSKSKNNGIEPELIVRRYGADTIRLFIMFAAPVEASLEWNESNLKGIHRFLKKLWILIFQYIQISTTHKNMNFKYLNSQQTELRCQLHKTIKKVSDDISRRKSFNTAISAIIKLVNRLVKAPMEEEQDKSILRESLIAIIKMLYPFTPHFCFFVWKYFNKKISIDHEKWPIYNEKIILKKHNILIIQINGKKRNTIEISNILNKEEVFFLAQNQIVIKKYLQDKKIKKIIYIPHKIINFVTS